MKRTVWVALTILLAGGVTAYFLMSPEAPPPTPPPVQREIPRAAKPAVPAVVAPTIRHPLRGVIPGSLPDPGASDAPLLQALGEALSRKWFAYVFGDDLIPRIVATVDNLPREKLPTGVMPLKRLPRSFLAIGAGDSRSIGAGNSARYAVYVRLVGALDAEKLVAVYVRFYPLFQRAYEDLGSANGYFNDRLVQAIDDLLAAPEPTTPIRLVRPMLHYEFADPTLEARSAGQKIMLRMGRDHAVTVKAKLREIRRLVASDAG